MVNKKEYQIKKMFFEIGYTIESISELMGVSQVKINKIVGINNHSKNDGVDLNGR